MMDIFETPRESIYFEDSKLYVALAFEPLTEGHSVVVWKGEAKDIRDLDTEEYEYLMDVVDVARDTLIEYYNTDKVYMMYLDEIKHPHWHLVPRYNLKGFNILKHEARRIDEFGDAEKLKETFKKIHKKMIIEN